MTPSRGAGGKIDGKENLRLINATVEGQLFDPLRDWTGVNGDMIMQTAIAQKVWGIASAIDIYNCDPEMIRNPDEIRRFVAELCDLIQMKRFQQTRVVHFGEDERVAGYSMVQLIETSLISAHFANQTNSTYLDVFSCKPYNPEHVKDFAQRFFGGTHSILNVTLRR